MTRGMKHLLVAGLVAGVALAAQAQDGQGYGPGMMWGGAGAYGPGMMAGNGPGYGPGARGGYGYGGMGPGMMGGYGYGNLSALDLTDQQRSKIDQIQDELRKKNWAVMGRLLDEQARMRDLTSADKPDPAAIGKQSMKMADLQRQMLEAGIDARNQIDAVLTKEQKAQVQKYRHSWWNNDGQ